LTNEFRLKEQLNDPFCLVQKENKLTKGSEFFWDVEGALYRSQKGKGNETVVPQFMVLEVIRPNHDHIFIAHPGSKRIYELIYLKYWWLKMRHMTEDYVVRCDLCQKQKGTHEYLAPLGQVEDPSEPFQVTLVDIMGQYPLTPRNHKCRLTFVDHLTK
jgi:hypothetical protein